MKKFLIGIAMFFTVMMLCVVSAGAETYGDYEYKVLDDGTVEITNYTGTATNLEIPSKLDGKNVTSIGEGAFSYNPYLETVIIPNGVTKIGESAFEYITTLKTITIPEGIKSIEAYTFMDCSSLLSVNIPDGVAVIGDNAFRRCYELPSVTIPTSVKTIGEYAFADCTSFTSVTIPDGVTSIGNNAFWYCYGIVTADISDSVTEIGDDVFSECYDLENINVSADNKYFSSVDGVLFDKGKTKLIDYPSAKTSKSYVVPSTVKKIDRYAFTDCGDLTSVTLPDALTSIGSYAFAWCHSLESIALPSKVSSIGDSVFYNCASMENITVVSDNESYTAIDGVLYNKDKTEIVCYPNGKPATSYTILNGVKKVGPYAFACSANLESVSIPEGVTEIALNAFADCAAITSFTLPDGVQSLGDYAFGWCYELKSINIPKSVTDIGECCFVACCELKSVVIPDGVTLIPTGAFLDCSNLMELTIPESVVTIDDVFYGCSMLTIKCYENSFAHKYAVNNGIDYKLLLPYIKDFAVKSRNYNSVTLNWSQNTSADGYILQQLKNGTWTNVTNITSNAVTSYQITGLAANTTYKFRAVAYTADGSLTTYSKYTGALAVSTAPAMTTGFAITGRGSDFLTVSWTKNLGASGYVIQEQIDGVWTKVVAIKGNTTTSYKITGLQPNSFHRYRMVAYKTDANGTCYGKYTGSAPGYTAPAMVSGFKVSDTGNGSLTLSWNKVPSAGGYVVDIYKNGAWSQLAKITSNATTSYKATGLNVGTTYKFRIKSYAVNNSLTIYSTYSSAISGVSAPSAPANLKMTNRGTDFISVRWDKNEKADGYMVYLYDGISWKCVKTLTNNSSVSHKITGLASGKAYKITVKAYKTVNGTKYVSDSTTISAATL
ncbi:MAG: leucine-rich repeat protein [Ruminiclostridium sp.]|nr:leucine-rich repeat protein [Ruminiclostridium sp.]